MQKKNIRLKDCFKHYTLDQDKFCSPTETVERFKKRLEELKLDVLEEVKRIDNGRLDIPVYFSVCGKDALHIIGTKNRWGKAAPRSRHEPVLAWNWPNASVFSAS